jgi:Transposase DDE domain
MARSILAAVQQIKADVAYWLTPDAIRDVCHALDYSWRERILDPVTTVHLFLLQILHGNTACSQVPRLGSACCTGEAYCQARARLPLALFRCLVRLLGDRLPKPADEGRWHGHRTFLTDGSSLSMPDTAALQEAYGQPGPQKPGCGFPVMHLLALFDAATGFLIRVATAPVRTHDMSQVGTLHPDLAEGDVLVGDRAFCSFAHLALLAARKVFGVFRVHQKQIVAFQPHRKAATAESRKQGKKGLPTSRWLKRLGRHDQLVEYPKPKSRPAWMTIEDYAALHARGDDRDHALGPRQVSGQGSGQAVWSALANRDQLPTPEADITNGCTALRDGGGRAEGVGGVCLGLQSGATGHARGGQAAAGAGGTDQFRGCRALASGGSPRQYPAEVTGQSRPTQPLRTEGDQATR